jgi:hypothetical protein
MLRLLARAGASELNQDFDRFPVAPVEQHRTGPTLPVVAALLGAGDPEVLAEDVQQRCAGIDGKLVLRPVHAQHDLDIDGILPSVVAWVRDWIGRQEAQDDSAGHATRDDRPDGPHTGDGPVAGAAVCGQDGAAPAWLWPLAGWSR